MHLDKLELLGFKSFPEKTTLKFARGISCIVGPNGCGKTNILDALRWVLGETRMSILRGGKLEEVIFSGTREVKPLGMAEVNLSIINDRGVLTSPYNQVTITRRLYRSGDSEFFINKVPCRRKDITEMFFDTGLTSGTYSVIEQDMIDVILSDKAEDRRHFFEEASGITKYKQRKKEALRKLESTEADLLRLEDLYSEVSSQAGALKRQVSKAERHKQLQDEIIKIGVELAIDKWLKIEEMTSRLRQENARSATELEQTRAQIQVLDLDRENIKLGLTEKENAIKSKREAVASLTNQLHDLETNISVLKEKSENTKDRHHQTINEIETLESKNEGLSTEIEKCQTDIDQFEKEYAELQRQTDEGDNKLMELTRESQEVSHNYDDLQGKIKQLGRELNENQESQITLDLKYTSSLEKIDELKIEVAERETEFNSLKDQRDRLSREKEELRNKIDIESSRRDSLQNQQSELKNKIEELKSSLEKLTAEYHQIKAEIEITGKVIHQYEGYTSGAAQLGKIKDRFPGIIDTVANLINPEPEYVTCVQTVLGELSNYFVVDTQETAKQVLEYGREHKLGRFGLIILDNIPEQTDPVVTFTNNENIIGQMSNFISADSQYDRLVKYLFKDILVARQLFDESGLPGFDMVSPDGEMLDFEKSLAIGGTEEILLVGQRARFENLNARHAEIESELRDITSKIQESDRTNAELDRQAAECVEQLAGHKESLASLNANLSQAELKLSAITQQLSEKNRICSEIEDKLQEIHQEKSNLGQLLDSRREQLRENESESLKLKDVLARALHDKDEYSRQLSNLKMKLYSMESSLNTSRNNHKRLLELQAEIEKSLDEKQELLSRLVIEITELARNIKEREEEVENIFIRREESSKILLESEGEIGEISNGLNQTDKNLKQLRNRADELSEASHEINMKMNSLSSQKENLSAETFEKYNCDLSSQSRVIRFDDDHRAAQEEQLHQLRSRLESLGPVNLLALEEYDQTKSRADFLKIQIDDLNKAKEDLKTTISRINSTARKKFLETFEVVKKNFKDVFCELFEGGESDLRLEEAADPLEAAIHISARPRGKKLLSIHQLSGGERALTATALLFSFYMVKPSPFCILDEVDAPLDDANIGRFLKLIKRFTENTQFIIITHNKLTMEQAETLYGITMSRPGMSQIVSVDLKRSGEGLKSTDLSGKDIEPAPEETEMSEESPEIEEELSSLENSPEAEQEVEVNQ